jgi:drug/metabolite transporter (DMT)-like permease
MQRTLASERRCFATVELMPNTRDENLGYLLGLIAVVAFAVTLPATRAAVRALDPVFVGLGRAVGAAFFAGAYLFLTRQRLPSRQESKRLAVVAAGVVVGFPLLSAWAMREVDASHGGVVLGILPMATAVAGALLSGERPSARFWLCAFVGTALVVGYTLKKSSGALHWADVALFGAVISASVGYAQGARLSRTLGGFQVISWALVFSAPLLVVPVMLSAPATIHLPLESWIGFIYVMLISQFLGFVPWYQGLALGGIAKVSQTQLVQPFLTIVASVLLLGETADAATWVIAVLVVAVVAIGKTAPVARVSASRATPEALASGTKRNR